MNKLPTKYWIVTSLLSAFILFTAWFSGAHPVELHQMGFPDYFRIELTTMKIIGAILLLIPQTPQRVREWIYAGFGICVISAFIAKYNSGYPISGLLEPPFVFGFLIFCIWYLDRVKGKEVVNGNLQTGNKWMMGKMK